MVHIAGTSQALMSVVATAMAGSAVKAYGGVLLMLMTGKNVLHAMLQAEKMSHAARSAMVLGGFTVAGETHNTALHPTKNRFAVFVG